MEPFKTVESVADYATALKELGASGLDRPFWFRGHPHSGYRLRASALREDSLRKNQAIMLKRFMQDAQSFLVDAPSNRWEWLFLAQHHGVPTILLDWSENALIALYFACERAESQLVGVAPPNGDVWVLLPAKLNQTCGTWSGQHAEDLPLFGVDLGLEKYHPLELVSPQETRNPVAALATRSFRRISQQWGTFTVTDRMEALEDHPSASSFLNRLAVTADAKEAILDELRSLGIEDRIVYPDLERLGKRVKELFV